MSKKKLLLAVTHAGFGGVAKHVIDLANHIKKDSDWEVDIACGSRKNDLLSSYQQAANDVVVVEGLMREISPINDLKAYSNAKKIIQSGNYDVVHAHGAKAGIIFRRAAFACKVPNIYTHHLVVYRQFKSLLNPLYRFVETVASNWCDYVVVVSKQNKNVLRMDGVVPENKLQVIYNGISELKPQYTRSNARERLGISEDTFFIVTVTRLDKPKDPLTLVKGFEKLCRDKKNCILAIVGDGSLKSDIVTEINARGLSNKVRMPGFVNDVDLYLASADVFCLATEKEGLPISILESMKYSLPVVANAVDGIPEQVKDGWNGYLIPVGNDTDFANKIGLLYANREHGCCLGRNGNAFLLEKFMAQANYNGLIDLYDSLYDSKRMENN